MRKQIPFLIIPVLLMLTVLLGGGQTLAQGPAGGTPQAGLGPAFTYQGQLKDSSGNPITNTCDFRFSLWDALSGGSQVGGNCTVSGVAVANGYFAAQVNAGGEFGPYAFTGDARWLEIAVQCAGDPGYTTLSPRQELTAAPYALSLRPGARVVGSVSGGAVVSAQNTAASGTGVYAAAPNAVVGDSSSPNYAAIVGRNYATTGTGYGLYGLTASADPNTAGVYGWANAAGGQTYGAYGRSDSPDGTGVYGYASATSGAPNGVVGRTAAPGETGAFPLYSTGVSGYATSPSGLTAGVWGQSASTEGIGVRGWASANSGTTYGVYGLSNSHDGYGVYGLAGASTGLTYGVYGESASTDEGAAGVYGWASATDGHGRGVYGRSDAGFGSGVYGYATATFGVGVYGEGHGQGVKGQSSYTGVYGEGSTYGVRGESLSCGVHGVATGAGGTGVSGIGDGYAVSGYTNSADGWAGYFATSFGNGVSISSNAAKVGLVVAGGSKSAAVATDQGARLLYTEESTEVWFTDYGFGQLTDGRATVTIDPLYAQTVNLEKPYLVFLTPQGDCGLYVAEKTATSFTVRALDGKTCSIAFDYRIVAKRLGFEDQRLAPFPAGDSDPVLYPEKAPPAPAAQPR